MSKSLGREIAIDFTQDVLGDVSNNQAAFSVVGQEYNYVPEGPLINKSYAVQTVRRRLASRYWESGFSQALTVSSTQLTAYRFNFDTIPFSHIGTGINSVVGGVARMTSQHSDPSLGMYGLGSFNPTTFRFIQIRYRCITGDPHTFEIFFTNARSSGATADQRGFTNYNSTIDGQWRVATLDMSTFPNWFHSNITGWRFDWCTTTGTVMEIDWIQLVNNPTVGPPSEVHILGPHVIGPLVTEAKINWVANTPSGTSVIVEYATGVVAGPYVVTQPGDLVVISTNIWLRVTCTRSGDGAVSSMSSIWLEDPTQDMDKLTLVVGDLTRFNNVVGDLTVSYDGSKGTLVGAGGAVPSFSRSFTPSELLMKPNQNTIERVTASVIPSVLMSLVTYRERRTDEERVTAVVGCVVNFIRVTIENPS